MGTIVQEVEKQEVEQKELAVVNTNQPVSIWEDKRAFNDAFTMAKTLANAEIIPQAYRGKVSDCIVAIDLANQMGVSPITVMQNSQVVRGNFTWKGTACKAMIDGCGKYRKSRYVEVGVRGTDSWGYYLEAVEKDGDIVKGTTVDIKMAKDEGWYNKDGSKWKTMPELMLKYRAAAFFMRTECAGVAMGFLTAEEEEDIAPAPVKTGLTALLDGEVVED